MATSLGGATLREPAEITRADDGGAVQKRMANGAGKVYSSGNVKFKWYLTWNNITGTDAATIEAKAILFTSQAFVPPDTTTSYTVQVDPGSYSRTPVKAAGGVILYNVSLSLRQV
jgi:hypothetical protein